MCAGAGQGDDDDDGLVLKLDGAAGSRCYSHEKKQEASCG